MAKKASSTGRAMAGHACVIGDFVTVDAVMNSMLIMAGARRHVVSDDAASYTSYSSAEFAVQPSRYDAVKKALDLRMNIVHAGAQEGMNQRRIKTGREEGIMIEIPQSVEMTSESGEETRSVSHVMLANSAASFLRNVSLEMVKKKSSVGIGALSRSSILSGVREADEDGTQQKKFSHRLAMSHVRCSSYHVPGARLAAAQAALEEQRQAGSKVAPETLARGSFSSKSAVKAYKDGICNGQ